VIQQRSFDLGDVVQLKSGGPLMTVYLRPDEYVSATWMDVNNQLNRASFYAETLTKINQEMLGDGIR
jgi:uncharacterized protein YodC (DUF2158 family)